jgi:hypothetical protein
MSEFYFDVKGWEDELAQRGGSLMGTNGNEGEEGGKKRKRPTKKDLVGFSSLSFYSFFLTFFFHIGTLQRTKETQEDCQDCMAAHVRITATLLFEDALAIGDLEHGRERSHDYLLFALVVALVCVEFLSSILVYIYICV